MKWSRICKSNKYYRRKMIYPKNKILSSRLNIVPFYVMMKSMNNYHVDAYCAEITSEPYCCNVALYSDKLVDAVQAQV